MEPQPPPGAEGAEGAEGGATGEPGTSPASIVKDYVRYLATGCNPQNPVFTLEQMVSLLPVTTGIQLLFVFIFMVVETSGSAGGTSGVAGTSHVLLFFVYIGLLAFAMLIAQAIRAGKMGASSTALLAFFFLHFLLFGASTTAALSNFGGEKCDLKIVTPSNGIAPRDSTSTEAQSWSLGTVQVVGPSITTPTFASASCGINSVRRQWKNVVEVIFFVAAGLPALTAGLQTAMAMERTKLRAD
eukprot:GHVU01003927.1.p1 GENE.GHVU01003927.1~~GHVU01003927.1.p1  ORF type:complete len:243 (+),score=40.26 GHVU01003927.1:30-758(+)